MRLCATSNHPTPYSIERAEANHIVAAISRYQRQFFTGMNHVELFRVRHLVELAVTCDAIDRRLGVVILPLSNWYLAENGVNGQLQRICDAIRCSLRWPVNVAAVFRNLRRVQPGTLCESTSGEVVLMEEHFKSCHCCNILLGRGGGCAVGRFANSLHERIPALDRVRNLAERVQTMRRPSDCSF